jgi:lipopolysaccharide export system protein LptA
MTGEKRSDHPGRQGRRPWLWLIPASALALVLAGAQALPLRSARAAGAAPAGTAKETVQLSGESVEYDVGRKISVVTGGPGAPATLVSGKLTLTGARLEYSGETGLVKVEGGVRLEQTAPDQVTVTARTLTADLKARTARLLGEVRLVSGKAQATAQAAFFQGKERQVTLTGDPELRSRLIVSADAGGQGGD